MRILLIVPSFTKIYGSYRRLYKKGFLNPPLSLCYLAAAIEKAGHTAKIIDGDAQNLSIEQILNEAKSYNPDLMGITATSIDFDGAQQLIKSFKKAFPSVPVIIGGTHINIFEKDVLQKNAEIDYGCIGDGEDLIQELMNTLSGGGRDGLENITGLIYRREGEVIQNAYRPLEKNIDRYDFPARHLLENEHYYRSVPYSGYHTSAAFMSSRGCPYKCVYCAIDKIQGATTVRLRSAENVLDELEFIIKKMGINHIAFNDDCLTVNKRRIHEVCEGIHKRGLDFTWEGISRADRVDRELLKAMKNAGFVRISYGIESSNEKILKAINKGETRDVIEQAYRLTDEVGIVGRGSVLIGSPHETKETVKETFRFIRRLNGLDQVFINILQPYPGTKVRDMVLNGECGFKIENNEHDFGRLQRFGSASISVNDLSPKDLVILQKLGFLYFYLSPKRLWRIVKINGIKVFWHEAVGFIRSIVGI